MHGMIFAELKRFVSDKYSVETWSTLLESAGLGGKVFMAIQEYPDADAVAIVTAASELTKLPANDILEAFGEFITPSLMKMYGHLAKPEWKTLEFIENAEKSIHSVVRVKNPGAQPPELHCLRNSDGSLALYYQSKRKMCALAKGIAKGVARHYGERLSISESQCMHKGAARCEIWLSTAQSATAQ